MTTPIPQQSAKLSLADTMTPLNLLPKQPIRLLLQGAPGEGKTWAALTFPNPIVLNLDNKLNGYKEAHPDSTIRVINFDTELCIKLKCSNMGFSKPNDNTKQPNVRDTVKKWLELFGPSFTAEDTLILDSWSSLQNAFDTQSQLPHEIATTSSGAEDKFAFWRMKQKYSSEITNLFKSFKCNIVSTCHEVQEYNDDNVATGKLKPLMQGGFAAQLAGQFTDAYRQVCLTPDKKGIEAWLKLMGKAKLDGDREYVWQTKSNAIFTACLSIPWLKDVVPATYESLIKKV